MDRKCKNIPDRLCYICGNVILFNCQPKITDFVNNAYRDYFEVKLDQDKPFASHDCCKTYMENLRDWRNYERKNMPFAIPIVRREGKDHITDWYFHMIILK